MRAATLLLLALGAGATVAARCGAQGQLSEKALVAQTVAGATVTVEYYRPVARGRANLFGGVVSWGENWTPGANWATTVDVDHDVKVEGRTLPKGKYSLWIIVRRNAPWTVDFHRRARIFHTAHPDSSDVQLRLAVTPDSGAATEVLTFDFPEVSAGATTLRLRWGSVVVPLHLAALAPALKASVAAGARARYLGSYDLEILQPAPGGPTRRRVDIGESGDTLHWRDADGPADMRRDFLLIPAADDEFTRARRAADGQYWPDEGFRVVFTVANGRATGYEVQLDDGSTASRAKRVP